MITTIINHDDNESIIIIKMITKNIKMMRMK